MKLSRRTFLFVAAGGLLGTTKTTQVIMTVDGPIPVNQLGKTLIHEHILVDFIGADKISYDRWDRKIVIKRMMPYLRELDQYGVKTFFDCTPAYLGRDVELLKMCSGESGIQFVTNTGYYGAVDNKYLPAHAFTETAEQLANRWIVEFEKGIEKTRVKPGFIKIGINPGTLSPLHRKLVEAACITHQATGLTICSHTGTATGAFEEMEIVRQKGLKPGAFVWVHAQEEKDLTKFLEAGRNGTWISLDGIGWGSEEKYVAALAKLRNENLLERVLISHDAGWYKPGEKDGGEIARYTTIFTKLVPSLKNKGFTESDLNQLLVKNPAAAFAIDL